MINDPLQIHEFEGQRGPLHSSQPDLLPTPGPGMCPSHSCVITVGVTPLAQSSVEHQRTGWSPKWKLASSLLSPALLSSIFSPKGNSSVFPHPLNASPAWHPQCLGLSKGSSSSTGWVSSFALTSLPGRGRGKGKHPL